MKKNVIKLIKILGIGLHEIVINIKLDNIVFNSIEWDESEDRVLLHLFNGDYDYVYDFDDLKEEQKIEIYHNLCTIAFN